MNRSVETPDREVGSSTSVTGDHAVARLGLVEVSVEYASPTGLVMALDRVSCTFGPAGSTAIVGRSGSGKSTLVSVLALLRTPTRGTVVVDGTKAPAAQAALAALRARHVGMIFQSFHLDPAASALHNVLLPWHFHPGLSRRDARARAVDLLERLGIAELIDRPVYAMSGGQRQRVAIARALLTDPPVLIADEPTGNLDEETGQRIAQDLFGLTTTGTTVIVVTHDAAIAAMAQRVIGLTHGRLADANDDADEVAPVQAVRPSPGQPGQREEPAPSPARPEERR